MLIKVCSFTIYYKKKAVVFSVVMYRCESWTIKKMDEHQKMDAFKLWYWRRLSTVLWTVRISNQSILKAIRPEYSSEELMLKFQQFGHLMRRVKSLEKIMMLGKIGGKEEGGRSCDHWMASLIQWT